MKQLGQRTDAGSVGRSSVAALEARLLRLCLCVYVATTGSALGVQFGSGLRLRRPGFMFVSTCFSRLGR